jgi:hypothetical protein
LAAGFNQTKVVRCLCFVGYIHTWELIAIQGQLAVLPAMLQLFCRHAHKAKIAFVEPNQSFYWVQPISSRNKNEHLGYLDLTVFYCI